MDSVTNEVISFSENENISLSTTPESSFGHCIGGGGVSLNELQGTFKDEFQQLKDQVAVLQAEQRKKAQKYQRQRKTSYFLRKKVKDRENRIDKILTENEEMRLENKEMHKHLKSLEQRVQNFEWGAERTKQGFKKDIKDLQDKAQVSEWVLEDINRNFRNIINDVEDHTAQIDSLERIIRPEDA